MKRKLLFITLLMLFCTTMFGQQHWTMSNSDIVDYPLNTTVTCSVTIEGQIPENITDLEIGAFHNNVLRGVAKPVSNGFGGYIVYLTVYSGSEGEIISFKLYNPATDKEYDTDYTIRFSNDIVGDFFNPVQIDFYSMHWSYNNNAENYMAYPCVIKIDGVIQNNPNLEIAAFINDELCGVAKPALEPNINIYMATLQIYGTNGQTINFKLFDPSIGENGAELETVYTETYNYDYNGGIVEIDFRNEAVAQIGSNYYATLQEALKAITSGCTLDILKDITIASDWDCRNTGATITVPVTINGNGKTIKFTGKISDGFNHLAAFRFEDHVTVNNLVVDMSEAVAVFQNRFSAISTKANLTVNESKFIGSTTYANSRAIIFGEGGHEGLEIVVNKTEFINWKYGVVDNMNGGDVKSVTITDNTFDNADVVISAKEEVTFTGNDMSSDSYVNITSYTVPNNVQVVANNNTNLAANTETECNQIAAPLANINAQDGFLTPVAEAGGKYYVTLQGAVDGVADSGTITLLSDIELAAQDAQELFKPTYNRKSYCGVYIPDDKTVVLELNGKTVSYLDTKDDFDNVMVMNLGNLTINDNSAEKTGKITYKPVAGSSQYAKFYSTIFNCGTLTVNAGTIENTAEAETDVTNAVDNHSRLSHEYGNNSILIVNGGTLSGAYYYAIRQYTHYFEGVQNRVVINDGNINGGIYMQHGDSWYYANPESNRLNVDCYLEIKGGNINVNTTSDAFGKIKSRLNNPDNNAFGLNISGGIINVPVELLVQRGVYYENGVSGTTVPAETPGTRNAEWLEKNDGFVQGGTFSQIGGEEEHTTNLELFLKKGYKLEQNANGTYGVVVDPEYGMQAKIVKDGTTTYYTTIADAIAAAQPGETVTILDGEYTADITINKAITVVGERDEQGNNLVKITGRVSAHTGATVKYLNVNNTKTGDYDCALNVNGKDIVVDGVNLTGYNAMRYCYASGDITIKNSTINGSNFAVHFDGSEGGNIVFENTDITGWASYAGTVNSVSYTGCYFDQGDYFGHRYYNKNISFTDCTFKDDLLIDLRASGSNVAFTDADMTVAEVKALFKDPYYVANGNVTLNNVQVTYAASAYTANGSKYFDNLQDAINEVINGGYITVRSNIELTQGVTVPAGKKITLGLNGYTITGTPTEAAAFAVITNNGNLTIDDTQNGKILCNHTIAGSTSYAVNTITNLNGGVLTVEAGTIENKSTYTSSNQIGYAIDNYSGATVVIKGGKVTASGSVYYDGIRQFCNSETLENNVTIEDGEVSTLWIQNPSNDNVTAVKGSFDITGGTLGNLYLEPSANFSGSISDGHVGSISRHQSGDNDIVSFITGGTFGMDVTEFCAFNYVCTPNGNGTYGVQYKPQQNNAFVIETLHELEAFRDAVNAGNTFKDQTVVLSGGVDLNPTRAINIWEPIGTQANPFKGTFDGGNNTISNLVVEGENNVGLFGYADNATIKNIKLENVNVKGTDCVGAIAGQVFSTSLIDNCHVSGSIQVEGQTNVGGIVGKYYTKVKNCSVIGDDVATSYVKGTYVASDLEGDNIAGIMGHGGENNTFENNTVKNITISGTRKVAGIVGVTDQNTDVVNCLVENVNIVTTATAEYAEANKTKAGHAPIVGSYTRAEANKTYDGTVIGCTVKNVTFVNDNNVTASFGPITGGAREGMIAPSAGVTASNNNIYMSTITGTTTNMYLMDPVAKIGTTEYYTLFDAVAAVQDGETITMLRNTAEEFAIDNTTANITLDMAGFTLTGAITPSNANLTIENGTINNENASYSAIEINAGTLVLNDVKVTSKRHGVRIDGAVTATINGGEYRLSATSGTRHAVNVSGGAEVTIKAGTFVGPAGTSMDSGSAVCVQAGAKVTIEGGDFSGGKNATLGVSGTMTVTGGTFDQDVTAYCPNGYVCQMNADNKYEVFFAVASITNANGTLYYASLQAAINAAENGETVKVEANVEATVMPTADSTNNPDNCLVYVANDKTIIIDLNGKTITVNGSDEAEYDVLAIRNHGNLTITDSNATAGTIKLNYDGTQEDGFSQIHSTILNFGTLTIDKVNIVNNATKGYTSHAIFNYSWGGNAILTINGGVISSVNKGYSVYSQAYDDSSNNRCEVYINGGTLSDGLRYDNIGYHAANGANVVIIGGVFETNAENKPSLYIGGNGTTAVAISGGTFSEPVLEEYCAAGYIPQDNGNGTYGVKPGQYVAQVGDVKYETLVEAVAAVSATDNEIIILANSTESVSVPADVIINLNEIETGASITAGGNLTFKGNGSIKTLNSIVGGTITVENGKTLALNNFSFGSSDNASATYTITGGTITANYGFFQHGVYALYSNFETGYMYYSYGSDITVYGTFHSEGKDDGLDYVRGKLTIANGGKSIHDKTLWVGQPASWGPMEATLIVEQGGYVKANRLSVYSGSALQIDATGLTGGETIDEVECNTLIVEGTVEAINNDKVMAVVEGNKIIIKAKPVMIVETDAYYATLAEAFAAANNQTVKVLQNITLTETVTIAADKTVTLDLNGKNLTGGANVNLVIDGELTIKDNVGNAVSTFRNHYVSEGGKLTLKSGILQNIETNTGGYGIFIENGGESIIEGGTVQAVNESNYAICVNGTLTIVDGNIVGKHGVIAVENPNAIVTIEDGEYTLNAITGNSDHIVYVYAGMVNIEGGYFTFNNFIANEGDSMIDADKENVSITGGTYTHDVNYYCHEYYAAIQGADDLWRVEQVLFAQTTALHQGWNWYSSYVNLSTPDGLEKLQTALGKNGVIIKSNINNEFVTYEELPNGEYGWVGNEFSIYNNKMYMIETSNAHEMTVAGEVVDGTGIMFMLEPGWNWIGYPIDKVQNIDVALSGLQDKAQANDMIKHRNDFAYFDASTKKWVGTLTQLEPGKGYKYKSNKSSMSMFYYTKSDAKETVVDNAIIDENYWKVESSGYANNMTITAMLSIDGEIVNDNYEIAAFANGECRGSARPIYVESKNAYMLFMTVFGDDVEELTFKYYDIDADTEYELSNVMNYSNDAIVGTIDNPYIFSMNILGIGENSIDNINIYPNPTTTDREINLQATCDKVEVFNALGVKVAEYHNVDTLDALETAGIYVIRITNDNAVKHCRLVVK